MDIEWRDVCGYEGFYKVCNNGQIFGVARKGLLKPNLVNRYNRVVLYKDGKCKTFKISRLVATVFIPNLNNLPLVNHIDGIKTNDSADNLEWCTLSENMQHAARTGLMGGEKHASAKLTLNQVAEIKKRLKSGEGPYVIARDYPVTGVAISRMKRNLSWKYV